MYKRLSIEEREALAKDLAQGFQIATIAQRLKRARSTIYREIGRLGKNRSNYSPSYSHLDAQVNQKERKQGKTKLKDSHWDWVEKYLRKKWSPEEISHYLKTSLVPASFQVSHESIYRHIYSQGEVKKKQLIACLRHKKKKRKRRKPCLEKRGKIKNARSIHTRPKEVEKRESFGHWEGDLVIGKGHQTAIGTLVERKSRYVKIIPLSHGKGSLSVVTSFAKALSDLPPELKESMTYDRGLEMTLHQLFTKLTGTKVYFADPRSPWQRGTNENTKGLLRDFFPKKTDFSNYDEGDFQRVEGLLNERPRKVLGFRTPREVFEEACYNCI